MGCNFTFSLKSTDLFLGRLFTIINIKEPISSFFTKSLDLLELIDYDTQEAPIKFLCGSSYFVFKNFRKFLVYILKLRKMHFIISKTFKALVEHQARKSI